MTLYEMFISSDQSAFLLFLLILILAISVLISVRYLLKLSAPYFFLGIIGIILGLVIGSVVSSPLTKLPGSIGTWFPPILNIFVTIAVLDLFLAQGKSLSRILIQYFPNNNMAYLSKENIYIIDTNVLIDGRILKIIEIKFLKGKIIISNLVIKELHRLADNKDPMIKIRGQRGLDIISNLREQSTITLIIANQPPYKTVDDSLVKLAKDENAKLITADVALTKIAAIEGIDTLNINELADALKPILLPGEEFSIKIIEPGRTKNQGVGYLSDGTMVIVQNAKNQIGSYPKVRVEKIHQTTTGTIIFANLMDEEK